MAKDEARDNRLQPSPRSPFVSARLPKGADVTRAAELAREAQRRGHREALAFLESLPGQDEYILCCLRHLHHRSVKLIQDLCASSREEMPLLMDLAKELEAVQSSWPYARPWPEISNCFQTLPKW
eukprot:symbB.v1.2.003506.t1/scaffold197.1/size274157/13